MNIIITRADEVLDTLKKENIVAVLSIEHPGVEEGKSGHAPRIDKHGHKDIPQRILTFWDSERPVKDGPDIAQVESGINFVVEHVKKGTVLVHCKSGKARSTALALGALSVLRPKENEKKLIDRLLKMRPIAAPNIIVVEHADTITGRNGKLLQAVKEHTQISLHRQEAEEKRKKYIEKYPEAYKRMYPEKFPKP